ncbi:MAG: Gfo/Idh/MocA family oxidoreductase [Deltaproteobacteria bacterium]|nr:Gfo/Idh/MocA family oxidoreductase [Deltaproteobacteria bacterium]
MKRIKVGIIGSGMMGPIHAEALRRLGYVDVVALGEANEGLARAKADELHIPKAYGDFRALVADPEIEVVHNCTPNAMHFEVSKAIIAAGKHVISEKPLARTSKESGELVELAAKAGVVNAIHFNYRNYPLVQHMHQLVKKGEFGRLFLLHGSYLQDWLIKDTDYNWRVEVESGGESRAVGDIGSHWFDTVQFITGEKVVEVMADLNIVHKTRKKPKQSVQTYSGKLLTAEDYSDVPVATEDSATILFRTQSGASGSCVISQVSAGRKNRLYLEADYQNGALEWNQEEPNLLWIGRRDRANDSMIKDASLMEPESRAFSHYPGGHPEGYSEGPYNLFANVYGFISAGAKGSPTFSTFADGHDELLICDAIVQSSRTRSWTKVAYQPGAIES